MGESHAVKVWRLISDHAGGGVVSVRDVCLVCVEAVGVDGAALWVATDLDRRALLHATDKVARDLEDAHFTLGEGPCVQGWAERGMVLAADLGSCDSVGRWPLFAPAAIAAGARAIFAFPLQAGAIRIGGLGLYRARPGPLSSEQLADAMAFASAAFTLVLDRADPASAGGDGGVGGSAAAVAPLVELGEGRAEVYQATGMVAVQLGTRLDEALLRLRAHAFAHGMSLAEVAALVVARRLRFSPQDR